MTNFDQAFLAVTGHAPFPWQRRLYADWLAKGEFPRVCAVPNGLGKTAVIAVWLIALSRSTVPRRLVYVVNRRTVVDQTTAEAEKISSRAGAAGMPVPAISTLRGAFADNFEWCADPSRPAVVIGTVDMIGSRLLFSGYGATYRRWPYYAGVLGQDAVVVHDEYHLEPAFQELLTSIVHEQRRCGDFKPLRCMALSATPPSGSADFTLTTEDATESEEARRLKASKILHFHPTPAADDGKATAEAAVRLALAHEGTDVAVTVFLNRLADVEAVTAALPKGRVAPLTGTMRGYERDRLVGTDPVFARFLPVEERNGRTPTEGTVYLVCTSAGEVGVNLSADHAVCDLTSFESMTQRLGRVNRFGRNPTARVDVVHPNKFPKTQPWMVARQRTLELLQRLDGGLASPAALAWLQQTQPREVTAAFAPAPETVPVGPHLFDLWSMTTEAWRLPGRPPVSDWLRGRASSLPECNVAWREEVALLAPRDVDNLAEALEAHPLRAHEKLRDYSDRVHTQLKKLAVRRPDLHVVVIDNVQEIRAVPTLKELAGWDSKYGRALAWCTVVLPPAAGGLSGDGHLDGKERYKPTERLYDVADLPPWGVTTRQRCRFARRGQGAWRRLGDGNNGATAMPDKRGRLQGMRALALEVPELNEVEGEGEEDSAGGMVLFLTAPRVEESNGSLAPAPCGLLEHSTLAAAHAERMVRNLGFYRREADALVFAARYHDLGKARRVVQQGFGNWNYDPERPWATALAKSGQARLLEGFQHFRHEFGSVLDIVARLPPADSGWDWARDWLDLSEESRELALHCIEAHHGRARPHFPHQEAYDPERSPSLAATVAVAAAERFTRLQRRYGRWGLAYLESIVRAADVLASRGVTHEEGKA